MALVEMVFYIIRIKFQMEAQGSNIFSRRYLLDNLLIQFEVPQSLQNKNKFEKMFTRCIFLGLSTERGESKLH